MNTNDTLIHDEQSHALDSDALTLTYRLTPVSAAVLAALSPGGAAVAQDADEGALGIDEIIVTATKRAMPLQDVAQSIEAFSQQDIERMVLRNMEDYTRASPSATLTASRPGKNVLTMRGISTSSEEWRTESRVAIYLDEQPITSISNQPDVRMVDIERIEILPGPQGTLLGSSSMSGAMRIITNKPDVDGFSGDVNATVASTDGGDPSYDLNATLNIPLIDDKLAMRIVGYTGHEGGYIDNVLSPTLSGTPAAHSGRVDNSEFVKKNQNEFDYHGGRIAALWNINDKWHADIGTIYQTSRSDGTWRSDDSLGDYEVARFHDEWRDDEWWQVSATFTGDLGFAEFTSTTSYFERETAYEFDNMYYNQWQAAYYGITWGENVIDYWATYYPNYTPYYAYWAMRYHWEYEWGHIYNESEQTRFAQEFRLTSTTDSKFQWMLGAFYDDVYDTWLYGSKIPGVTDTIGWYWANYFSCYYASLPNGENWNCPLPESDTTYVNHYRKWIKQTAVFGEFDYSFTDRFTASVGARWFRYDRDEYQNSEAPKGMIPVLSYGRDYYTSDFWAHGKDEDTLFKFSLKYDLTDDAMVYFTRSEGFRLGGYNPPKAVATGFIPETYDADSLINYELGLKSSWFDNRLRLNLALFQIDYDGIQVNTTPPNIVDDEGNTLARTPWWLFGTFNAGAAENKGFEFNGTWHMTSNLKFEWSVYRGDATFTETSWVTDDDEIANPDEPWFTKGAKLAQSPELKYRWALDYTVPQAFGWNGELYFRYDESYQDEYFRRPAGIGWDDLDDPDAIVPDWRTANVQAGFYFDNGWSVSLFVRNVWGDTASNYLSSYKWWLETDIPGNADRGLQVMERTLQRPRTTNLQISKKF
jgi:outer membrane receptor protein involved in Fe transport